MLTFAHGTAFGMFLCFLLWWVADRCEWKARRKLERRVDELYRHSSCGEGYLGCNGGPNCPWDHK